MNRRLLTLFGCIFAASLSAQTPIVFQPGPGANDSTDQGGINGGKDALGNENQPSENYGGASSFYAAPISNCNQTHAVGFLQFDLDGLPFSADSVFVGFTHYDHTTYCHSNCIADFYFAYLLGPWQENSVNYSNFPAQGADIHGPIHIEFPNSFGIVEYDITQAYNTWKSGGMPNYGFIVYSPTIGCNNAAVTFQVHTSDDTVSANRPYLKIYGGSTVGLSPTASASSKIYPNPANHVVEISGTVSMNRLSMLDVLGKEVHVRRLFGAHSLSLDVSGIPNGVYTLLIESNVGALTKRISVQH